jgi:hypothetical protein
MNAQTISLGRDAALILLSLEALLLCLAPAVALYLLVRKLYEWLPHIRPFLQDLTLKARMVEERTKSICGTVTSAIAALQGLAGRIRTTLSGVMRRR